MSRTYKDRPLRVRDRDPREKRVRVEPYYDRGYIRTQPIKDSDGNPVRAPDRWEWVPMMLLYFAPPLRFVGNGWVSEEGNYCTIKLPQAEVERRLRTRFGYRINPFADDYPQVDGLRLVGKRMLGSEYRLVEGEVLTETIVFHYGLNEEDWNQDDYRVFLNKWNRPDQGGKHIHQSAARAKERAALTETMKAFNSGAPEEAVEHVADKAETRPQTHFGYWW